MVYRIIKFFDFGHIIYKVVEIKRLESACFSIFNHSNSTAGVDNKDMRLVSVHGCK